MDKKNIRSLLGLYRSGDADCSDPRFEEARKQAENDPDLGRWWAEEQQLDAAIGSKLSDAPVPAGWKTRLLRDNKTIPLFYSTWRRNLTLAAAAIVILLALFSS